MLGVGVGVCRVWVCPGGAGGAGDGVTVKRGGHVRENKKDERTYLHGKFCALKGQGDKRAQRSKRGDAITG